MWMIYIPKPSNAGLILSRTGQGLIPAFVTGMPCIAPTAPSLPSKRRCVAPTILGNCVSINAARPCMPCCSNVLRARPVNKGRAYKERLLLKQAEFYPDLLSVLLREWTLPEGENLPLTSIQPYTRHVCNVKIQSALLFCVCTAR